MPTNPILVQQAAVVPLLKGQVCLVTSRSGKRWVIPKGNLEAGKTAQEIALQEAWEEAGLAGLLQQEPIGSYFYDKDNQTCHVLVFQLNVTDLIEHYPESGMRQRVWLPIAQALGRIEDAGLREILRGVAGLKAG